MDYKASSDIVLPVAKRSHWPRQIESELYPVEQRGQEKYTIKYSDLDEFLGSKWFICGIDSNGDFCYVMLKTVCFYLSKKSTLVDFTH